MTVHLFLFFNTKKELKMDRQRLYEIYQGNLMLLENELDQVKK